MDPADTCNTCGGPLTVGRCLRCENQSSYRFVHREIIILAVLDVLLPGRRHPACLPSRQPNTDVDDDLVVDAFHPRRDVVPDAMHAGLNAAQRELQHRRHPFDARGPRAQGIMP